MAKVKKTVLLENSIEADFYDDGTVLISDFGSGQDVVVNFMELMKVMKVRETEMLEEAHDRINNLISHVNSIQSEHGLV